MYDGKILAENITKFRKQQKLSQQQLAQRLFVTPQSVSKWERAEAQPDISRLCMLSETLGVSVDRLLSAGGQAEKRYMIAIDGGGTKTECMLLDMQGAVKKRVLLGGSNPSVLGLEQVCQTLHSGIAALYVPAEQICGIFAGISGCGVEGNKAAVTAFLQRQYPNALVRCDTDVFNVLGCAPVQDSCVLAICGTGSVVYAHENGSLHRLGGWGYLLDADGSGFGIGRDALCATLAWEEGIGPETQIAALVEEKLGGPVWNSIDSIYAQGQKYVASFAPAVFVAGRNGDRLAGALLQKHFGRMAWLIAKAREKQGRGDTVILSGGLLQDRDDILPILQSHLGDNVRILVPSRPQIFGACVQCCRMMGVDTDLLEKTFEKDYKKMKETHHA